MLQQLLQDVIEQGVQCFITRYRVRQHRRGDPHATCEPLRCPGRLIGGTQDAGRGCRLEAALKFAQVATGRRHAGLGFKRAGQLQAEPGDQVVPVEVMDHHPSPLQRCGLLLPPVQGRSPPLAERRSRCAVVGYPNHNNAGDLAIWCGMVKGLDRLEASIVYASDSASYDQTRMRKVLGDGPILICGGGSLGDLWPSEQTLREAVIAGFPGNRIVQLPQSMHFASLEKRQGFEQVARTQPSLTFMWRERRSYEDAKTTFAPESLMCPDLAYALGNQAPRRTHTSVDVLWLLRRDRESRGLGEPAASTADLVVDWPDWYREDDHWTPEALEARASFWRSNRASSEDPAAGEMWATHLETFTPLARARLDQALELLGSARVVVSDRLHGHILATLLGVPNVVLDNSYGKVRAVFDMWPHEPPSTRWARDLAEARAFADMLVSWTG